jgi:hypothetical protein
LGLEISFAAIRQFFKERMGFIRRVQRKRRGDIEPEEIESEAWLVASDIARKRNHPFDLDNADDQRHLLGSLYNKLVKFTEKHFRTATSLSIEDEEGERPSYGSFLARTLAAPTSSDPQHEGEPTDRDALIEAAARSFTEASAYILLLDRFQWQRKALAMHLMIAIATLRERVARAGHKAAHEPSLFDGISTIDPYFRERIGNARAVPIKVRLDGNQMEWTF